MKGRIALILAFLLLAGCVHKLRMHAKDGQTFAGRYRFGAGDSGLIQVTGPGGELLSGRFTRISRADFVDSYHTAFGLGSIAVYGPEMSDKSPFAGMFGSSSALPDSAHGESFNSSGEKSEISVHGPLFYWNASLVGERGTKMVCYLIGSSYTGHGFGKCKSDPGPEYTVEF